MNTVALLPATALKSALRELAEVSYGRLPMRHGRTGHGGRGCSWLAG
jgi:hypothetical protein